jgi:hypothetical protein
MLQRDIVIAAIRVRHHNNYRLSGYTVPLAEFDPLPVTEPSLLEPVRDL